MIWVILFTILFSSLSESPYLNRGSEKLVKKYITDKDRRKEAVQLIKPAKKTEKAFLKTENKIIKEIFEISKSRDTEAAAFDELFIKYRKASLDTRNTNVEVVLALQNIITREEWEAMKPAFRKELKAINDKHYHGSKTIKKYFIKLEKIIAKEIKNEARADKILNKLTKFEDQTFALLDGYSQEILDESSMLYSFQIDEDELVRIQDAHQDIIQELFGEYRELYDTIVENTTEDEFKRISKKLKLPF